MLPTVGKRCGYRLNRLIWHRVGAGLVCGVLPRKPHQTGVSFTVPIGFTGIFRETSGREFDLAATFESPGEASSPSFAKRSEGLIGGEVRPDGAALAGIRSACFRCSQAERDLPR